MSWGWYIQANHHKYHKLNNFIVSFKASWPRGNGVDSGNTMAYLEEWVLNITSLIGKAFLIQVLQNWKERIPHWRCCRFECKGFPNGGVAAWTGKVFLQSKEEREIYPIIWETRNIASHTTQQTSHKRFTMREARRWLPLVGCDKSGKWGGRLEFLVGVFQHGDFHGGDWMDFNANLSIFKHGD